MVGKEVGDPDGPRPVGGVDLLQDPPGVDEKPLGRARPVDEVQVDHLNAERLPAGFKGLRRAGVLPVAQLGGDEELLAGDSAGGDRGSHGCFVAVGGGRVDVPVAGLQRVLHHLLGLLLRDLEHAEAKLGNGDPVVQRQVWDYRHANSTCLADGIASSIGTACRSAGVGPLLLTRAPACRPWSRRRGAATPSATASEASRWLTKGLVEPSSTSLGDPWLHGCTGAASLVVCRHVTGRRSGSSWPGRLSATDRICPPGNSTTRIGPSKANHLVERRQTYAQSGS